MSNRSPLLRLSGAIFACAVVLAGCAAPPPPAPDATLYARIGGLDGITAMVDDGIAYLAADPRINGRFANASVPALRRHLIDLVCLRTGGPCAYTGRNMSAVHEGLFIRADEFDALVEDVMRAVDRQRVAPRERAELRALLVQMKSSVIEH